MLQLLRENQVAATFRKAMKKAPSSVVAVPFWGKGALAALGLSDKAPIRIICNLDHPGCNPCVIADIRALGIKVRTHPRLHAKIYATPDFVIVGSSNASTNGLTVEGSASTGWIEANVACDDPQFVEKVLALLEEVWDHRETRPVRAADIEAARRARAARPPVSFAGFRNRTLLAACRENPEEFLSVYVVAYTEELGENAARMLTEVKRGALPPRSGLTTSDFRRVFGYQLGSIPEGVWLIDLDCRRQGNAKVWGCAQVTGLRLQPKGEPELTIALRQPIRIAGRRLPVSTEEKASLVAAADKIARVESGLVALPDVIKMIDRTR